MNIFIKGLSITLGIFTIGYIVIYGLYKFFTSYYPWVWDIINNVEYTSWKYDFFGWFLFLLPIALGIGLVFTLMAWMEGN